MAHKIAVRKKPGTEGKISAGANTEIYLDGKLLAGAYFMKFEVHARKIAKVTIEMYAEVEIDAELELGAPSLITESGKKLAPYKLSSFSPIVSVKE